MTDDTTDTPRLRETIAGIEREAVEHLATGEHGEDRERWLRELALTGEIKARLPAVPSRRGMYLRLGIGFVLAVAAALVLTVRLASTTVELTATASDLRFVTGEDLRWSGPVVTSNAVARNISGAAGSLVSEGLRRLVPTDRLTVTAEDDTGAVYVTLPAIVQGTETWLNAEEGVLTVQYASHASTQIATNGAQRVTLSSGTLQAGPGPRDARVVPCTDAPPCRGISSLRLRVAEPPVSAMLATGKVTDIFFTQPQLSPQPGAAYGGLTSGRLRVSSRDDDVVLQRGDRLRFEGFQGTLANVTVTPDGLRFGLYGRVDGVKRETPTGKRIDLMPTIFEWWTYQDALIVVLSSLVGLFGVLAGIGEWLLKRL